MPSRRYRSRTYKKIQIRTSGGRFLQHYKEKRPGVPRCASCGHPLGGVPIKKSEIGCLPRSQRRPNRPFGGYLCTDCMRKSIKEAARV